MKKETKVYFILGIIIIGIIVGIFWLKGDGDADEVLAKCLGENSELYTQIGCPACKTQEEMFNGNYEFLTTIDCSSERARCEEVGISGTPTWIIDGELYKGIQSIEKLKELTGC
jgi:hypothetical protein